MGILSQPPPPHPVAFVTPKTLHSHRWATYLSACIIDGAGEPIVLHWFRLRFLFYSRAEYPIAFLPEKLHPRILLEVGCGCCWDAQVSSFQRIHRDTIAQAFAADRFWVAEVLLIEKLIDVLALLLRHSFFVLKESGVALQGAFLAASKGGLVRCLTYIHAKGKRLFRACHNQFLFFLHLCLVVLVRVHEGLSFTFLSPDLLFVTLSVQCKQLLSLHNRDLLSELNFAGPLLQCCAEVGRLVFFRFIMAQLIVVRQRSEAHPTHLSIIKSLGAQWGHFAEAQRWLPEQV